MKSCTMFGVQADGREITTVEGLVGPAPGSTRSRRPSRRSTACSAGSARPGMMLVGAALIEENPDPSDDDVRWAISGQHLPLHRLHEHREGDPGRGRERSGRSATRARQRLTPEGEEPDDMASETEEIRGHRPQRPPRRGRPLHPRRGQLHRRHRTCPGCCTWRSCAAPTRTRTLNGDRRVDAPQALPGVDRRRDRRADGPAQPRVDAHALRRHAGGAGDRQGAVPGSGGRGGDRRPTPTSRRTRSS